MTSRFDRPPRIGVAGVATLSILAIAFAMGLSLLADLGGGHAEDGIAAIASGTQGPA
jgi:hypothetical protein